MKQLFEFFPLIVFFVVYYKSDKDLYLSIAAVIVATFISLIAIYFKERKISTMMLVSTVILVVFGGLSIFLKNEIFFKMKPPIITWSTQRPHQPKARGRDSEYDNRGS
mgnify:CR=1 FL=1